jgi:hypothetical protein
MTAIKNILVGALVLFTLVATANAKTVWEQINETAPVHTIFTDLDKTAP